MAQEYVVTCFWTPVSKQVSSQIVSRALSINLWRNQTYRYGTSIIASEIATITIYSRLNVFQMKLECIVCDKITESMPCINLGRNQFKIHPTWGWLIRIFSNLLTLTCWWGWITIGIYSLLTVSKLVRAILYFSKLISVWYWLEKYYLIVLSLTTSTVFVLWWRFMICK